MNVKYGLAADTLKSMIQNGEGSRSVNDCTGLVNFSACSLVDSMHHYT